MTESKGKRMLLTEKKMFLKKLFFLSLALPTCLKGLKSFFQVFSFVKFFSSPNSKSVSSVCYPENFQT
jgi:hypothetical protein